MADNDMENLVVMERKKFVEELVNNSIISKDEVKSEELKDKLSKIFVEVERMIRNNNDKSLDFVYDGIISNFFKKIDIIVRNSPGLTIGIKDNISNGELYFYGGKVSSDKNALKVDEDTRFDLASVSKLFTAISLLKKSEAGKLNLQKNINHYSHKYANLNVSLEDAAKFYYQINTDGRLDIVDSKEQLLHNLYNSKVVDENTLVYSDIPYIILGDILKENGDEFEKFFNDELKMVRTSYDVKNKIITGGKYYDLGNIHDTKAKNMMNFGIGNPGHAGIYSTSEDLVKLGNALLPGSQYLSGESMKTLTTPSRGKYQFFNKRTGNVSNKNRAMGIYIQTDKGISESDMAIQTSKDAIATSGTTGPYMVVDPLNNYTFNYLVNPYSKEEGCVPIMVDGEEKRWASVTNVIKEELVNLVYELRFAGKVMKRIANKTDSSNLNKEIEEVFETKRIIKK